MRSAAIGRTLSSETCYVRENHVYFIGSVSKSSVYYLGDHINRLNTAYRKVVSANPTCVVQPKPIYLHINSYGGGVFAAFAAIDFIKQSAIPVHTIVEGATASAGTLMSVVGAKRYIRPYASMLIHQLSSWLGGKFDEIEDEYQNLTQMHDTIKRIYTEHTRISKSRVGNLLKKDLWWTADRCIREGLADSLWEGGDVERSSGGDVD